MDFTLSPDIIMLRDMLRKFLDTEVRPLESKYFTTGSLEPKEYGRLRSRIEQMGLWGANLPMDLDGGELDQVTACVIEEELGKTFIPLEIGDIPPMLLTCRDEQVSQYLRPLLDGERRFCLAAREPKAIRPEDWCTFAKEVDGTGESGGFLIHGAKLLSALPQPEDFLVVFAQTEVGITAFLVDADQDGLEYVKDAAHTVRGTGLNTSEKVKGPMVLFNNCHVQQAAVLGESGRALELGAEEAPRGWIRIGARYVGFVGRLIEMSAEYACNWEVMGRPLSERPAVQRMLAELSVQLECCRWLVYHAAWQADQKEALRIPVAQVQLASGALLEKAIDWVVMVYGGPGPSIQMDEQRFLLSTLPYEAMEMMLESSTAVIANHILTSVEKPVMSRS